MSVFQKRNIFFVLLITALAFNWFIIFNSLLDAAASTQESDLVVEVVKPVLNTIKEDMINETNISTLSTIIRKGIGHFGLFLANGVISSITVIYGLSIKPKKNNIIFVVLLLLFGFAIAGLTEIIQLSVPGRSGEMVDVLIDYSGYFLSTVIIVIISYAKKIISK